MLERDAIYAKPLESVAGFTFDQAVARVFPDMINRSVPGYTQIVAYLGLWAARYVRPNSTVYDLGCSLGASTLAIHQGMTQTGTKIIAVDNAPAMLERFEQTLQTVPDSESIELRLANLQDVMIDNASLVVLNFTLQFIEPAQRDTIIGRIYNGLNPGGLLILSEKIIFPTNEQTERFIDIHHDFKRANGYSDLEVAQKRTSLENVLIPETIDSSRERMLRAGFDSAEAWFQAFNFMSMVAIK